jgi:tRNA 5-methylaminomethyl-2-thiouridine biosynthesis bifunctional protein
MTLQPTRLARDADGVAYSERYRDVYASRDGALGQARHVFLGGNALPERWRGRDQFVILETGFGLGTNFLATLQAWRADSERPRRLHYVSVEKHPLAAADLVDGAAVGGLANELACAWPLPLSGLHRIEFDDGRVMLTLAFGDARELVPQLAVGADAIYLDGFAPDRNPEMWEPALLKSVARCARPQATLATWCTARPIREALSAAGFEVELQPGFGHKRQMLVARYAPSYVVRPHEPRVAYCGERTVLVIGAGLAGATCADALARRGWTATVVDAAGAASAASALPWGLVRPHFAADDNRLARLTRAAAACAAAGLKRVAGDGRRDGRTVWQRTGVLQQATDESEAQRWRAALESLKFPHEFVRWIDRHEASSLLGPLPAAGGLWWPDAMAVSAADWISALLSQRGISTVFGRPVARLLREGGAWTALDGRGGVIAFAPVAIVAAATDAPRLLESKAMPVQAVAGRATLFESHALSGLLGGIAGDGTLLRVPDGTLIAGATFESEPLARERADASNLARLNRLLEESVAARVTGGFNGVRCVARDHLPYVGPVVDEIASDAASHRLRGAHLEDLPRRPHLYAAFALGSRGLGFAPLAAELLAARIEGEPAPVERDLERAVDPGRMLLRWLRTRRCGGAAVANPLIAPTYQASNLATEPRR